MRHQVDGKKLGRTSAHRKAMFANMAVSLINHERIETTLPKAKELRRFAEKLITLGKSQTQVSRRRAYSLIKDHEAVSKLFDEIAKRYSGRSGGYTRILKLGFRHGDNAPMALIEYVGEAKGAPAKNDESLPSKSAPKPKKARSAKPSAEKKAKETVKKTLKAKTGTKAKKA